MLCVAVGESSGKASKTVARYTAGTAAMAGAQERMGAATSEIARAKMVRGLLSEDKVYPANGPKRVVVVAYIGASFLKILNISENFHTQEASRIFRIFTSFQSKRKKPQRKC